MALQTVLLPGSHAEDVITDLLLAISLTHEGHHPLSCTCIPNRIYQRRTGPQVKLRDVRVVL